MAKNTEANQQKLAAYIVDITSVEDLEQYFYEKLLSDYEADDENFQEDWDRIFGDDQ